MRREFPSRLIIIDKSAATLIPRLGPAGPDGELPVAPWWDKGLSYVGYRLGRDLDRTAIIGVGGGRDILAPLAAGAERVDGYEINGLLIDLLRSEYRDYTALAGYPQVSLIHDEARVGITHSGHRYDVIQASMIDTWAATASGGFVLSENGLYTLDAWRSFYRTLTEQGILTFTRHYVPGAPAEAERLVSLGVATLTREGVADPRPHILLLATGDPEWGRTATEGSSNVTILASRTPFTAAELDRVEAICREENVHVVAGPREPSYNPTIRRLLQPETVDEAIESSRFDISPPHDERPYFFLLLRPHDAFRLSGAEPGAVQALTFRALRVLLIIAGLALVLAAAVLGLAMLTRPTFESGSADRRRYRWMGLYFLGIGFGYILVQLGLLQRLSIVLGHPLYALAVVLFVMLLTTGFGAYWSERWFDPGSAHRAWLSILTVIGGVTLALPAARFLEALPGTLPRLLGCGVIVAACGFVLGFAFPLGVRLVAPTGERAVQMMWAVNGAASIAATALAAMIGVSFGAQAVLGLGFGFYLMATLSGLRARTRESES